MKKLTEEGIKNRCITPAIERAGWCKEQVFMEHFFTYGQVSVRGNKILLQDKIGDKRMEYTDE